MMYEMNRANLIDTGGQRELCIAWPLANKGARSYCKCCRVPTHRCTKIPTTE
jgi:hypothetical protein